MVAAPATRAAITASLVAHSGEQGPPQCAAAAVHDVKAAARV